VTWGIPLQGTVERFMKEAAPEKGSILLTPSVLAKTISWLYCNNQYTVFQRRRSGAVEFNKT
jgi:hypothetical protein